MFNKAKYTEDIIAAFSSLPGEYEAAIKNDYAKYMKGLEPGAYVEPMGGKLKTQAARDEWRRRCADAAERVSALKDEASVRIQGEMAEAPGSAALAYVQSLDMRDEVSKDEMDAAFANYGSNWTLRNVLKDIAKRKGVNCFFPESDLEGALAFVDETARTARNITIAASSEGFGSPELMASRISFEAMCMRNIASGKGAIR